MVTFVTMQLVRMQQLQATEAVTTGAIHPSVNHVSWRPPVAAVAAAASDTHSADRQHC